MSGNIKLNRPNFGIPVVSKHIDFALSEIGRGQTAPTLTRDTNCVGYAFTINDDGYMNFVVPSDWKSGTDIEVSVHIYTDDVAPAEVRFQGAYSCLPEDGSVAIDGAVATGTLDSGDYTLPAVAKGLVDLSLGSIPAACLDEHYNICILLKRIALVGGSNPGNNPVVISAQYEYQADKLGDAL